MNQSKSGQIWLSLIGVVVIVLIAWGVFVASRRSSPTDISNTATSSVINNPEPLNNGNPPGATPPSNTTVYKNGTYTAEGSYISPGGHQSVKVTLTLNNDVVTALTVTPEPSDPQSAQYQSMFVSGIKQYVIGKNIADVQVSRVSGSSLTSGGFNQALSRIKTEAQA